jgi:dephospho-CoA kinase
MVTLGITGGIGMGKSLTGELLRKRGVMVVDTDDLARELVQPGTPALEKIRKEFGDSVFEGTGELRREKLAEIVFSDVAARKTLENILHPLIRERWRELLATWRERRVDLAAVVIPLLFETNAQDSFDATIAVACGGRTQRQRLHSRGWTSDHIEQRLAAQQPIERKIEQADFVVWTESSPEIHLAQLERILKTLRIGPREKRELSEPGKRA